MRRWNAALALALAGALACGCAAALRAPQVTTPRSLATAPIAASARAPHSAPVTRAPAADRQATPSGPEPTPAEQSRAIARASLVLLGILLVIAILKLAP